VEGWPRGDLDQSCARMSAPIFPPPARNFTAGAGVPIAMRSSVPREPTHVQRTGSQWEGHDGAAFQRPR